jgi:hypothetical protein
MPMIDLLLPTLVLAAPEMTPLTRMIFGASPATAEESADREETVTVGPPAPPLVL